MNTINTLNIPPAPALVQGGLVSLFDHGVLITGPSGVGKSELLLALIDRGHSLISDDVTLIRQQGRQLIGTAPAELAGMMQIHGCGLFNVREIYGDARLLPAKSLQLVIHLNPDIKYEKDPLQPSRDQLTLLGVALPRVEIPLPKPRDLALIIELLVRKEIAKK